MDNFFDAPSVRRCSSSTTSTSARTWTATVRPDLYQGRQGICLLLSDTPNADPDHVQDIINLLDDYANDVDDNLIFKLNSNEIHTLLKHTPFVSMRTAYDVDVDAKRMWRWCKWHRP